MNTWIRQVVHAVHARHILAFAIGAVVGAVIVSNLPAAPVHESSQVAARPNFAPQQFVDTPPGAFDVTESLPLRLRIPEVGIDAPFSEPLGITDTGEIAVPETYDAVGWYQYGPVPGAAGPAVVLGHVDSYTGPAVFYPLADITVGDEIFIERGDGSTVVFAVTAIKQPTQDAFPTARVYGDIDHAGLRLITCTGTYDHGVARYSHNLIVYAKLIRTESSERFGSVSAAAATMSVAELTRRSSPFTIFIDHRYQTLWWMLLLALLFFGWSVYDDRFRRADTAARAAFIRNATFTAVYVMATLTFFAIGLLELFWWLLALALVSMAVSDHHLHTTLPGWDSRARDRFYITASLMAITSALVLGFPAVWWPFFFTFLAAALPRIVRVVRTRLQLSS